QALDDAIVGPADLIGRVERRAASTDRPDLMRAGDRLRARQPQTGAEVICHGDFHPFNLLVDGDRVSVVDWSVGLVADPAFDLAFTALTMSAAPIAVPRALRGPVRAAARSGSRWFLRLYRRYRGSAGVSVEPAVLDWYTAVHCYRALAEVAEWVATEKVDAQAGHPWLLMAPQMAVHLGRVSGERV